MKLFMDAGPRALYRARASSIGYILDFVYIRGVLLLEKHIRTYLLDFFKI